MKQLDINMQKIEEEEEEKGERDKDPYFTLHTKLTQYGSKCKT